MAGVEVEVYIVDYMYLLSNGINMYKQLQPIGNPFELLMLRYKTLPTNLIIQLNLEYIYIITNPKLTY